MCGNGELETAELSPEALAGKALELRSYGNIGLAYTYNEPLIGCEYIRDCTALVRERGMVNVLVNNGTIEKAPWRALLPLIDAANTDLKGFTPEWCQRLGGDLETVKRSIFLAPDDGQTAHTGGVGVSPGRGCEGVSVFCLYGELLSRAGILCRK